MVGGVFNGGFQNSKGSSEQVRYEKAKTMMITCKTRVQLANAIRWVNLLVKKYGGFAIHHAMSLVTIRGVMMQRLGVLNETMTTETWS